MPAAARRSRPCWAATVWYISVSADAIFDSVVCMSLTIRPIAAFIELVIWIAVSPEFWSGNSAGGAAAATWAAAPTAVTVNGVVRPSLATSNGTVATAATEDSTVNVKFHWFLSDHPPVLSSASIVVCATLSMSVRALRHIAWCASRPAFSTATRMNWLRHTAGNGSRNFCLNAMAALPVQSSR